MNKYFVYFILLILGVAPISSVSAESSSDLKSFDLSWLSFSSNAQARWLISKHPDNEGWLRIRPRSIPVNESARYKVLALISKKSKSYEMAMDKLLEVFNQQQVLAQIDVVNIGKTLALNNASISYAERQSMDLIFSMGSDTAGFLHEGYSSGKIPVVTSTNKDPVLLGQLESYDGGHGRNIAYTSLNVPLSIQMDYILTLKPNLKAMVLMYNKNHKQVMATEVRPTKVVLRDMGIQVLDVAVTDRKTAVKELESELPQIMEKLQTIDPSMRDIIFWVTSSTAVFSNIETINRFTENVPVLAAVPNAVVEGDNSAVIAIGIDRRTNAHLATLYAIDILTKGVAPGDLPVGIVTPPDISINFRIARKNGLRIPLRFFESAAFVYDYEGRIVRDFGLRVSSKGGEG